MVSELERSGSKDRTTARQESRSGRLFRQQGADVEGLQASPLAGAQLLQGLTLTATAQDIEHGLGRDWVGALLSVSDSPAVLVITSTQTDQKWIGLSCVAVGGGVPLNFVCDVVVY